MPLKGDRIRFQNAIVTSDKQAVRSLAPAKINLVLRVLGRRPDGYHNLWSLMQTVELTDELHIRLLPETGLKIECNDEALPTDGRNLVYRAAHLVLNRARMTVGLHIRILKRIPISAGLGGGSSDAAATILGLNHLLGLQWSMTEMAEAGQLLGSDVSFFFSAPTAYVRGRGEDILSIQLEGKRWLVLINPGFPVETRWAYDRLAASRSAIRPLSSGIMALSEKTRISWDDVVPLMENDFEDVLAPTHPMLGQIRAELLSRGAEAAMISGSGATVFGLFRQEAAAAQARDSIARTRGWWTCAVRVATALPVCHEVPWPDSFTSVDNSPPISIG
jgi:4-diphosphocytidyl-2-C-methyl-D-erythritol kinase